jgi:hypothetical protein
VAASNTFGYQFRGGKRGAIVVGVNSYPSLPDNKQLHGAENDAQEIFEKLKLQGSFDTGELLINQNATCDKIRSTIYDILFDEKKSCDQVVFYFAGHGFCDPFDNTFIAPADFDPSKPFYKGILMKELDTIFKNFRSSSKKIICTFLDCCHSGDFVIKGRGTHVDQSKFPDRAQKSWSAGEGMIGLASMDSEGTAREITLPHNFDEREEHCHGIFTYHLIEALEGTYSDKGIITFSELSQGLNERIAKYNDQQLYPLVEGQGDIMHFELVLARRNIEKYISLLSDGCKLPTNDKISIFSARDIAQRIAKLQTFKKYYEQNKEIVDHYRQDVEQQLSRIQSEISNWIEDSITTDSDSRNKLNEIHSGLFENLYLLPADCLSSFDAFINASNDRFKTCVLDGLGVMINNPQNTTAQAFIVACKRCVDRYMKTQNTTDTNSAKRVMEGSSSSSPAQKLEYGAPKK